MLQLEFDPAAVQMPTIKEGARAVREVVVTNREQDPIEIGSATIQGDDTLHVLSAGPKTIQPGEKGFIEVLFTTSHAGQY